MATTKIWQINGRLDKVMKYIANPVKTWNGGFEEAAKFHQLSNVLQYTADEMKTEKQFFVTGVNCSSDPSEAVKHFMETKRVWGKTDGVVCYHSYQSFARGEVTPELAHKIGLEFAQAMWGDRFEVLVSTHLNTKTVHNHFVVNSVSFQDGMKFCNLHSDYRRARELSDGICRKYGLSVIEHPGYDHESMAVIKMREEGRVSQRDQIRSDIDSVISMTTDFRSFCHEIQERGYLLEQRGSFLRVRPDNGQKFFRLDRLGDGYTEEDIRRRLRENYYSHRYIRNQREYPKRRKAKGLYALYLHYMYLLGGFQKFEPVPKEVYAMLREDSRKMQRYSDEAKLLGEHGIDTADELGRFIEQRNRELSLLIADRTKLTNKLRRMHDSEEMKPVKEEREHLTAEIVRIRKELRLCSDIAERSGVIEQISDAVDEYSETKEKEEKKEKGKEKDSR